MTQPAPHLPHRRPSARRLFWLAIVMGALFLVAAFALAQLGSNGQLLRLFTRQDSTWQSMQVRGAWRVGMDPSFPPFQSLDESGAPVGYDVDLARAMAAAWGLELEIVPLGYDSLLDALQAGRIDSVVSALPYDERGTRDFAFSPPYFEAGIRLAVPAQGPPVELTPPAHVRLAVEWGSLGDMVGRRLHRSDATIQVIPFETPEEAIAAVLDGNSVDGLLMDNVALRQAQGRGAALVAVGPVLEGNAYVMAVPLRATTLQTRIGETLEALRSQGLLDELEERWFGPMP